MKTLKFALAGIGITATLFAFQNCGKMKSETSVSSSAADGSSSVPVTGSSTNTQDLSSIPAQVRANACNLLKIQAATTPLKILVIVDQSGSNAGGYASTGTYVPGTDPNKAFRLGSITQFFANYQNNTNISWGFETFQNQTATSLIRNSANQPAFTTGPTEMQAAMNVFASSFDTGTTPYQAALSLASSMITSDLAAAPANTDYAVVFLSDGLPTDVQIDTAGQGILTAAVSALVGLSPGHVSFSTVYYGTADVTAGSLLQGMAQAGGGKFLNLNVNPSVATFMVSSVVAMPGAVCAP